MTSLDNNNSFSRRKIKAYRQIGQTIDKTTKMKKAQHLVASKTRVLRLRNLKLAQAKSLIASLLGKPPIKGKYQI